MNTQLIYRVMGNGYKIIHEGSYSDCFRIFNIEKGRQPVSLEQGTYTPRHFVVLFYEDPEGVSYSKEKGLNF
jgi:hypothetical protein